jgi:hypothetical protein
LNCAEKQPIAHHYLAKTYFSVLVIYG